jgi:hypothetical protein
MARYPTPFYGKQPRIAVLEERPTCHRCSWVWQLKDGRFLLKFISQACWAHRLLPA